MEEKLIIFLSGLLGAIIGSATTIISMCIKEYYQRKRDQRRFILELALSAHNNETSLYKERPNFVTPLPVLFLYYSQLVNMVEEGKDITTQEIERLAKLRHDMRQSDIV